MAPKASDPCSFYHVRYEMDLLRMRFWVEEFTRFFRFESMMAACERGSRVRTQDGFSVTSILDVYIYLCMANGEDTCLGKIRLDISASHRKVVTSFMHAR